MSDFTGQKPFPFFKQRGNDDCGYACLRMIAKFYGMEYDFSDGRYDANFSNRGVSLFALSRIAKEIGFVCVALRGSLKEFINEAAPPCIVHWKRNHFMVVYEITGRCVRVANPASGLEMMTHNKFRSGWEVKGEPAEGVVLKLRPGFGFIR